MTSAVVCVVWCVVSGVLWVLCVWSVVLFVCHRLPINSRRRFYHGHDDGHGHGPIIVIIIVI